MPKKETLLAAAAVLTGVAIVGVVCLPLLVHIVTATDHTQDLPSWGHNYYVIIAATCFGLVGAVGFIGILYDRWARRRTTDPSRPCA